MPVVARKKDKETTAKIVNSHRRLDDRENETDMTKELNADV